MNLFTRAMLVAALCLACIPQLAGREHGGGPRQRADGQPGSGQDPRLARLGAYIEQARVAWDTPGLAVSVVQGDEVVFERGFGVRQSGSGAPVDASTLFEIGSTTKAFTAAAIGMLVDDGRLGFDDPVVSHLPWFQLEDPWLTRHVTIRDLLSHRTGVEDGFYIFAPLPPGEVARRARFVKPSAQFRQEFLYSNLMYGVAGEVIEAVSGMDWAEFVQRRILDPLGMEASATSGRTFWEPRFLAASYAGTAQVGAVGMEQARAPNLAMPHVAAEHGVRVLPWRTYDMAPAAGSLVSNLADMSRWLRFQLGDGSFEGRRLLKPGTLEQTHAPQIAMDDDWIWRLVESRHPGTRRVPSGYAMGWNRNGYRGHACLQHGGALYGWYAHVFMLPDDGTGVVVLTNRFGSAGLATAIALRAFDMLLGVAPEDWSPVILGESRRREREADKAEASLRAQRLKATQPSLPLAAYAGRYGSPLIDQVDLALSGGRLELAIPGGFSGSLEHWHDDTFRLHWHGRPGTRSFVTFRVDPRGRIDSMEAGALGTLDRLAETAGAR